MYDLDVDFRLIERREPAAFRHAREDAATALQQTLRADPLCWAVLAGVAAAVLGTALAGVGGSLAVPALLLGLGAWLGLGLLRSRPRRAALQAERSARATLLEQLRMR
jgi:hypothetical protein